MHLVRCTTYIIGICYLELLSRYLFHQHMGHHPSKGIDHVAIIIGHVMGSQAENIYAISPLLQTHTHIPGGYCHRRTGECLIQYKYNP